MHRRRLLAALVGTLLAGSVVVAGAGPVSATPVCTDGFMGGPSRDLCGGRVFPESAGTAAYVQFTADPVTGFREYLHGLQFLAKTYPRWVSVFTLADHFSDVKATSAGADLLRPDHDLDTHDGRELVVIKVTDHQVPDAGKDTLLFSLSIHGNERGGLEGGVRTIEDLAIAASGEGTIVDGVPNYTSATGKNPEFHTYPVSSVLRNEAVYFIDFNVDGWAIGDLTAVPPLPYTRGNSLGTDLNRQMPTVGFIDHTRNPLEETETRYGHRFMHEVAAAGIGKRMAFGGDIHGELTSPAYVDIMYPAGQFTSLQHRRNMAIAERTKSVIDDTLFDGIIDQIEEASGGNDGEGYEAAIPTKPAHWATVWDTLGYTDTGFVGDYIATDLAFTGLDYEIYLNHTIPDKAWTVYLQENHINATRAIVKTAMAYALTQHDDFTEANVRIPTVGQAGYVFNPDIVTDADGPGRLPGPAEDGKGANGKPVVQQPYRATQMQWFSDTSSLLEHPFRRILAADVARPEALQAVDSLVLADVAMPKDADGRPVDRAAYFAGLKAWVERGGNLVLTDKAMHALADMGLVGADDVFDIDVYQPYVDIADLGHPLVARLRANARQLVEATLLGYGIGDDQSPMTAVESAAFAKVGGTAVGTSGGETQVTLGAIPLGKGRIVVLGGALPTPTESNDHRYGLRNYALTYTGTYILENALKWDVAGLGGAAPVEPARSDTLPRTGGPDSIVAILLAGAGLLGLRRRHHLAPKRTSRPGRAPVGSPFS